MSGHHPRETVREFLSYLRSNYHVEIISAERGTAAKTPSTDHLVQGFATALSLAPDEDDQSPELAAALHKAETLAKQVQKAKLDRDRLAERLLGKNGEIEGLRWAFERIADRS